MAPLSPRLVAARVRSWVALVRDAFRLPIPLKWKPYPIPPLEMRRAVRQALPGSRSRGESGRGRRLLSSQPTPFFERWMPTRPRSRTGASPDARHPDPGTPFVEIAAPGKPGAPIAEGTSPNSELNQTRRDPSRLEKTPEARGGKSFTNDPDCKGRAGALRRCASSTRPPTANSSSRTRCLTVREGFFSLSPSVCGRIRCARRAWIGGCLCIPRGGTADLVGSLFVAGRRTGAVWSFPPPGEGFGYGVNRGSCRPKSFALLDKPAVAPSKTFDWSKRPVAEASTGPQAVVS